MHNAHVQTGPLVTIVTVTYNSAAFVRDAIESVLAQEYANIEYIIADDCSGDETWGIISSYNDPRIKAFRNESNIGEYPNRNKAISMATGKYLIFIDGDDYIYPHGIGYFVKHSEQFDGIAFTVQQTLTSNVIYPVVLEPADCLRNYFFGSPSLLSDSFIANFFNVEILKRSGGLSEAYRIGDEEIRLRLMCNYPVLFIQGWVAWFRRTPGQASSQIHDGTAFFETVNIVKRLIRNGYIKDEELARDILMKLKRDFGIYILSKLKRLSGRKIISGFRQTGFSLADVLSGFFSASPVGDKISRYSPAHPLRYSKMDGNDHKAAAVREQHKYLKDE